MNGKRIAGRPATWALVCLTLRVVSSACGAQPPQLEVTTSVVDEPSGEATESPLAAAIDPQQVHRFEYTVGIRGQMLTPSAAGVQTWKLSSDGKFQFLQRQFTSEGSGPLTRQAIRRFETAETRTSVGQHSTGVQLPLALRTVHVQGTDAGLVCSTPATPMTRQALDLLQMPCDPLAVQALLPTGLVEVGDEWNTPAWAATMMAGLEATIEQSIVCRLTSLTEQTASVDFSGTVRGAVHGSSSDVKLEGALEFDRGQRRITSFQATQTEDRSPGPVSPGLKATIDVLWTQRSEEDTRTISQTAPTAVSESSDLSLQLLTRWGLQMRHSREWHVFHETPKVLMLRQMRNGALVSQCNVADTPDVAPGDHISDQQFLNDVATEVTPRGGKILSESTLTNIAGWRIRHVRANGNSSGSVILWDYYLCTASGGQQFSLLFSHSEADEEAFSEEPLRMLKTLSVAQRRPAIPFR